MAQNRNSSLTSVYVNIGFRKGFLHTIESALVEFLLELSSLGYFTDFPNWSACLRKRGTFCLLKYDIQKHSFGNISYCCSILQLCPTLRPHRVKHAGFTISPSLLKLMSIVSVMPSTISSSVVPSLPALNLSQHESFQMSQLFTSGGQSIGVTVSVLPVSIQDWSPLGCTGWFSLHSKGLSRVFSNTTVQKHQFCSAQLSL